MELSTWNHEWPSQKRKVDSNGMKMLVEKMISQSPVQQYNRAMGSTTLGVELDWFCMVV